MKNNRMVSLILLFVVIANCYILGVIQTFAHDSILDIGYDECIAQKYADGTNEMWYVLDNGSSNYHLPNEEKTIKYYFKENTAISDIWPDYISESDVEDVKNAYVNSMKKWNNVYFYSYNEDGTINKKKIINVIEGTENDHNLTIFFDIGSYAIASTKAFLGYRQEWGIIEHYHYTTWRMWVNIEYFLMDGPYDAKTVNNAREKTGAHELGHVLGLSDIDINDYCKADVGERHHSELLMGYGTSLDPETKDITYKDIAGVAITRGFHTDNDHRWLYCEQESAGEYKLLCSICNGVKRVDDLSGYTYDLYNFCSGNHSLSSGNMFAVASYGTQDYYKCKYCRYVAPYSLIVTQEYRKTFHSAYLHKCDSIVEGLSYSFYEAHNITYSYYTLAQHNKICEECGLLGYEDHAYTLLHSTSDTTHTYQCECGEVKTESHHEHSYTSKNNFYHYVYCECGYLIRTENHDMYQSGKYNVCRDCDCAVNRFTDITIKGEKDEPEAETK